MIQHVNRKGGRILKNWFHGTTISHLVLHHFPSVQLTGHFPQHIGPLTSLAPSMAPHYSGDKGRA